MKKLFVIPVAVIAFTFGNQSMNAKDLTSDTTIEVSTLQEKYTDVAVENLPQAVIDAVAKDYAGATISKAAANKDASNFKLELAKENGESMELVIDAKGNWAS
ncbi:hypothetical protein ACE939_14730 [Aquimarina sp. W85]|uniref:hypothetical protein n=1 Tax=Aquimarina rhodophyticola TaxID=3342246 RepID=UPI003670F3AC